MKKITYLILIFLATNLIACGNNKERFSAEFTSFDTFIQIQVFTRNQAEATIFLDEARELYDNYHKLFDPFNNYEGINNVKTINDNAGKQAVVVDPILFELIAKSVDYYNQGLTKTNITLAPVTILYSQRYNAFENGEIVDLPTQEELNNAKACIGMENIVLDSSRNSVFLKNECNALDLGAVAKGYATNLIADQLKEDGLRNGLINAGGNVAAIGDHPDNRPFVIGIADPDNPTSFNIKLNISNTNVVTSGDYQRYFIVDGTRYHHLIDPDTLKPGRYNRSVTIVDENGLFADFASTNAFLLPASQIQELAVKFGFSYIIIEADNNLIISDDLKDAVTVE